MHFAEVKKQVVILGKVAAEKIFYLFICNKNGFHFQQALFTLRADGDKVKQPRRDESGPTDSTFLFPSPRPDRQTN